ncbi:glycosyltransferase family 2 protein [Winogradskyella sp. HB-48]|uniref:glycosyltransferase family 2 protein n=1 Tax=Winogradskyella sp. HB-48 TaxID=3416808 RepID=UPI003CEAE5F9
MMLENDISIVVPVYNEVDNLSEFYERLTKTLDQISKKYQIIFINDGSVDASLDKIIAFTKDSDKVFYLNLSRNFGHQIAVSAGLEYCNADCTVIIDSDLQDPPELIAELYQKYNEGFDVVYAKRMKRDGDTFLKKITAKLYYRLLRHWVSFEIPLDTGDYRLISKKLLMPLT